MGDSYTTGLPTSHLLGSVPAVTIEDNQTASYEVPGANLQNFPPNNGVDKGKGYQTPGSTSGMKGYQTLGSTSEENGQQSTNSWNGVFSVSSYTQYFNVDTDVVLNRLMSSLNPISGDFFNKIDANPDLYGAIWITTTLIFVLASLGNCATYLSEKRSSSSTTWSFDVNYFNVAACSTYIYATVVPLGFYFLLRYMGSNPSLVRFWCMWGYSLFLFVLSSVSVHLPFCSKLLRILRWIIIIMTGAASATFVASNISSHAEGNDLFMVVIAAFALQFCFALFLKIWFFA